MQFDSSTVGWRFWTRLLRRVACQAADGATSRFSDLPQRDAISGAGGFVDFCCMGDNFREIFISDWVISACIYDL